LGSLLWILILGVVLAVRGHHLKAGLCLGLFGAGAAYLSAFAPWKRPDAPLWKPYLGFVLLLCASCVAVFFAVHDVVPGEEQLSPWMLLLLLPLCLPIFGFGRKSWSDLHGRG
jgi:peptidoglycan/LPS O-acetylase OafA/YrhL